MHDISAQECNREEPVNEISKDIVKMINFMFAKHTGVIPFSVHTGELKVLTSWMLLGVTLLCARGPVTS